MSRSRFLSIIVLLSKIEQFVQTQPTYDNKLSIYYGSLAFLLVRQVVISVEYRNKMFSFLSTYVSFGLSYCILLQYELIRIYYKNEVVLENNLIILSITIKNIDVEVFSGLIEQI